MQGLTTQNRTLSRLASSMSRYNPILTVPAQIDTEKREPGRKIEKEGGRGGGREEASGDANGGHWRAMGGLRGPPRPPSLSERRLKKRERER